MKPLDPGTFGKSNVAQTLVRLLNEEETLKTITKRDISKIGKFINNSQGFLKACRKIDLPWRHQTILLYWNFVIKPTIKDWTINDEFKSYALCFLNGKKNEAIKYETEKDPDNIQNIIDNLQKNVNVLRERNGKYRK